MAGTVAEHLIRHKDFLPHPRGNIDRAVRISYYVRVFPPTNFGRPHSGSSAMRMDPFQKLRCVEELQASAPAEMGRARTRLYTTKNIATSSLAADLPCRSLHFRSASADDPLT